MRLAWCAVLIGIAGCPDPATPPTYTEPCQRACARGRDLGCDWSVTTPAGATCEQVCEATERSGYATIHPECLAVVESCEDAERVSADGCAP